MVWPFLPQRQGFRKLEKALSSAVGSCLSGAISSSSSTLGEVPSSTGMVCQQRATVFSQAIMRVERCPRQEESEVASPELPRTC